MMRIRLLKNICMSLTLIMGIAFLLSGCYLIPVLETPGMTKTATLSFTATKPITLTPTETRTPTPVSTATTASTIPPTITPTPFIPTYKIQQGSPTYLKNFAHPDIQCSWLGVAGQIFGSSGKPIINLVVNIRGTLGSTQIDEVAITGIPGGDIYGPGGFEIKLSDSLIPSQNILKIQIFDLEGNRLSEAISFSTYADCSKNLIIINFISGK